MNVHRPAGVDRALAPADPADPLAEGGGIDLRAKFATVWRGRWIVAVCIALALVTAFLVISQMRPAYRASSKVLFEPKQAQVTTIGDVLQTDINKDTLQNEVEILSSTGLIGRVVDRLGLQRYREVNPALGQDLSLLDRLRALFAWRTYVSPEFLADLGIIEPPAPPPVDAAELAGRVRLDVVRSVEGRLELLPVPGSRVIEIAFTSTSPRLSAAIVNAIGEQYIDDQLDAKLSAARRASEWLADRIEELRERVEGAELAVESARADLARRSGQTSEVTRQQLVAINTALAAGQAQRAQVEVQYDSLSTALADAATDLGAITLLRETPVIARLREQEADIRGRETTLATLSPDNPTRVRLRTELAAVREDIRSEASRILAALRTDLKLVRDQEAALGGQVRELEATEQEQRRGEVTLRQLEREAQANRSLYENFLARLQETTQQESLQSADARILSPAAAPSTPVASAKMRILVVAAVLGVGFGVAIVFLVDRLNNTFRGVDQLEAASGLAVLASLPSIGLAASRADVVRQLHDKPNGSLAEAVRNLRTSVLFSASDTPPKVVVFTSSTPGEGKSTSSLLLAMTTQQMGRSAVIVDCDLRLHALSNLIGGTAAGGSERPGLLSVLEGRAALAEAVHVDPETGLEILATQPGERAPGISAADVVASQKFASLVATLTQRYDLVVLDTPPVLVVTDARIIARLADAVVYAVRWDDTPRGAVLEGLREMRSVNAPLAGLVLTMVDTGRLGSYAYEGYGYYRSRYHEYYG